MIVIVDYDAGNIASIQNMLKKIGQKSIITSDPEIISSAKKLILPGVGSFDYGMTKLKEKNLISVLNKKVLIDKIPILGICLGVQLFTKKSEEGVCEGLGWIDAETVKFNFGSVGENISIPHMGWNEVSIAKSSKITSNLQLPPRFYFVHTYHLKCNNPSDILFNCNYGYPFVAGIEKDNIVGVQFHPEKSHKFGMEILTNFSELYYK